MGVISDYAEYDAVGLAELVSRREVTPLELVAEAIRRIEQVNPELNAVTVALYDQARKVAQGALPEGPFKGVPFLLKDLISTCAGAPFTKGCKALKSYVATEDSELVRRFKAAGLVILGKTNTSEFGILGVTEPEAFGPTRNPWNPRYGSGGSSGGSAAAVAAGMVPVASGGDGGGSIRIPSSCCGVFGLKPSRGRNPTGPHGELWQGAAVEHVLTRSVRDSAAMLDAICGPDPGGPYALARPERPYGQEIERDPGRLRIAFSTESPLGHDVHPECAAAVERAAALLGDLGHYVEEARPDHDGREVAICFLTMLFGEIAAEVNDLEPMLGRKPKRSDVEITTWTLALLGRATSALELAKSKQRWNHFAQVMRRFHESYDVHMTPTLAVPPLQVGELDLAPSESFVLNLLGAMGAGRLLKASGIADRIADKSLSKMPFTTLANLTGQPAMSLPLHWTAEGLPCGVHFMAPPGDEATLLRLAGQLEKAAPWLDKAPPVFAS